MPKLFKAKHLKFGFGKHDLPQHLSLFPARNGNAFCQTVTTYLQGKKIKKPNKTNPEKLKINSQKGQMKPRSTEVPQFSSVFLAEAILQIELLLSPHTREAGWNLKFHM